MSDHPTRAGGGAGPSATPGAADQEHTQSADPDRGATTGTGGEGHAAGQPAPGRQPSGRRSSSAKAARTGEDLDFSDFRPVDLIGLGPELPPDDWDTGRGGGSTTATQSKGGGTTGTAGSTAAKGTGAGSTDRASAAGTTGTPAAKGTGTSSAARTSGTGTTANRPVDAETTGSAATKATGTRSTDRAPGSGTAGSGTTGAGTTGAGTTGTGTTGTGTTGTGARRAGAQGAGGGGRTADGSATGGSTGSKTRDDSRVAGLSPASRKTADPWATPPGNTGPGNTDKAEDADAAEDAGKDTDAGKDLDAGKATEPAPRATVTVRGPRGSRRRAVIALLIVAAFALTLDAITKQLAVSHLDEDSPVRILGGAVYFVLTRNSGAAFSMGTHLTWLFPSITLVVIVWIAWMASRLRSIAWAIALGLVLGGALGNLTDRVFRAPGIFVGHVVDYISVFSDRGAYFPIFNAADSCLTIGVILAILLELTGRRRDGSRVRQVRD